MFVKSEWQHASLMVVACSAVTHVLLSTYICIQELFLSLSYCNIILVLLWRHPLTYTGMLSKSRGQVLRIATIFHVLFCIDNEDDFTCASEVSERAVKAAVNFVQTACQQTAFIVGKGLIQEEVQAYKIGMLCIHRSIQ